MNVVNKSIDLIKINGNHICSIMSKDLLNCCIRIPNIQRICDNDKVNDIVDYQNKLLLNNGYCNFQGVLNIQHCRETDECYLIDGQHRLEAIRKLNEKQNIPLFVEVILVDKFEEVVDNFSVINKNTPLPDFPESIDKNIPEETALFFKQKYPSMWSKNSRARRPHVYFNYFQEALGYLTEKLDVKKSEDLKEIIETQNKLLTNWTIDNYPDSKNINESMTEKCRKDGFYLGLYKHESEDSCYEWVRDIVYTKTGERIKKSKKLRKANIPKALKMLIWDKYVGYDKRRALCICCCEREIEMNTCNYGHIVSESSGGSTTEDNLLPICSQCNSSMHTKNMGEYIQQYHPLNFKDFQGKKYTYKAL